MRKRTTGGAHGKIGGDVWTWIAVLLGLTFMAAGCATTTNTKEAAPTVRKAKPSYSRFLSHYERLQPVPGDEDARRWLADKVKWNSYDQVMIAPIQVFLKDDAQYKGIDPNDLKQLVDYFHNALVKQMSSVVKVVDKPGPGVLVVRVAIVDLVPTRVWQSAVGTATPFGFVAELASGAATHSKVGSMPYLGKTGIEVQVVDGGTGRVVAEYLDKEVGRKYVVEMDKNVPDAAKKWADGYLNSFKTWGYTKVAFDKWAKLLRRRFEQLRGAGGARTG